MGCTFEEFKKDFKYKLINGVIVISKFLSDSDVMVVPGSVEGITEFSFKYLIANKVVTEVIFDKGVTKIFVDDEEEQGVFSRFKTLTRITFPNTVEFIDGKLFDLIPNEMKIIMNDSNYFNIIDNNLYCFKNELLTFSNKNLIDITIPEGITKVRSNLFNNCVKLESISFPSTINIIENNAFKTCRSIKNIYFESPLKNSLTLHYSIFTNAFNIKEIKFPEGFKSLISPKKELHLGNIFSALEKVYIPDSVENLDDGFMNETFNLNTIELSKTNQNFILKDGILYNKDMTLLIRATNSIDSKVSIPNTVVKICNGAFYSVKKLESIIIPNSVTTIGKQAFCRCDNLNNIELPNSVTTIEDKAFERCSSITKIDLPNQLLEIEKSLFLFCEKLEKINISESVTKIHDSAFDHCYNLSNIFIPENVTILESAFIYRNIGVSRDYTLKLYTPYKSKPEGWILKDDKIEYIWGQK